MTTWQEFHFLRPYFLAALILPLLFYFMTFKNSAIQSSWANVCDEKLLRFLLVKNGGDRKRRIPLILAYIISVLTVFALAGPTWVKKQNPSLSVDNPVMVLLNMSSDMWMKDVTPSRAVRAKYIVKDLLQSFGTTETGLLVYSREPFVVTPMTEDASLVENLLPAVNIDIMPENGDRLDRAIDLAVERMQAGGYAKGNLVILTSDVGERFDAALESAAKAGAVGFDVNIINVGSSSNEKLKMISEKGNGIYLNYNENLSSLSGKINDILAKELKQSLNMQTIWEDMGYYVFWLPALLLLYYFRKGILVVLFVVGMTHSAFAGWFLNDNQEGMKKFEAQDYEGAAQTFTDGRWRGAAAYKNGDYEAAYEAFAGGKDTTALYNQGNALAKSGKIDEAIKKYEEVLAQDENFEDARFNLEYLKKQKQNQQNQQQQQQQQQNKQEQQQQQQKQSGAQQQQEDKQQQGQSQQQQNAAENSQENQDNKQDSSQQNNGENQSENSASDDNQNSGSQMQQTQNTADEQGQNKNMQQNNSSHDGADGGNSEQQSDKKSTGENARSQKTDETNGQEQDVNSQSGSGEQGEQEAKVGGVAQEEKKSPEEQEKIRARMQKFREIPEDKGGLLRAFIKREYDKKRYLDK